METGLEVCPGQVELTILYACANIYQSIVTHKTLRLKLGKIVEKSGTDRLCV
jgi:hypothetical protein